MAKINRILSQTVRQDFQDIDAVFINGGRQTGKSTFVENFGRQYKKVFYLSLDDITVRAAELTSPGSIFENIDSGLIILDEVQLIPGSFWAIKAKIDRVRRQRRAVKFLLTGSADIALFPQLAEALVGRMYTRTMYPFSAAEVFKTPGTLVEKLFRKSLQPLQILPKQNISSVIEKATFPRLALQVKDKTAWCQNYISTLVERDIKNLADIDRIETLPGLLSILANRVGGLLNDSDLANAAKLSLMTLRRYRALFENVFLVSLLPPWHKKIEKRFVKSPKIYFNDTRLLCHLLGVRPDNALRQRQDLYGFILENFILSELKKQLPGGHTLYHFRTQDQKEIDFIIEKTGGDLVALEVKAASTVSPEDFKHIRFLQKALPERFVCGAVIYQGHKILQIDKNLYALPIESLWQL
ncbi:putative AAA family ATPase [Candidatus Termititenax aidoneus]|uniref:AAA family ATPase n=1 Tax=Termititenax aidoneus TaxID=2218524 RepID=A0A388TET4_TERA1|nr:putative AAA family ATPase [Candidatus Termititenax aidoneus]